jgi:hypothetical protein
MASLSVVVFLGVIAAVLCAALARTRWGSRGGWAVLGAALAGIMAAWYVVSGWNLGGLWFSMVVFAPPLVLAGIRLPARERDSLGTLAFALGIAFGALLWATLVVVAMLALSF